MICEYCDQGVHLSCLHPVPEKRPKVTLSFNRCCFHQGICYKNYAYKAQKVLCSKVFSEIFSLNQSRINITYKNPEEGLFL